MQPASAQSDQTRDATSPPARRTFRDPWLAGVIAWVAVYAGAALYFTRHGSLMTPDSTDYAEVARSLIQGKGDTINRVLFHVGRFPDVRHPLEVHGLLTPLLLVPLFAALGPQDALVRVPGILFMSGLGFAAFYVGRRLAGLGAGLLAAALILSRRDFLFMGIVCSDDVGEAAFVLAALWAFARACQLKALRSFLIAGCFAAAAALQKMPGMLLPGVFFFALLPDRENRSANGAKRWIAAALPSVAVAALYSIRNYRVWGRTSSPYVALEWYGRDDLSAYFAYYRDVPRFSEFLAEKGVARVLELVQVQLSTFGRSVLLDPLIIAGAMSMVWLARKQPIFARSSAIYSLFLVALVCGLHHVDIRYFSPLYPLAAVSVAAAVCACEEPVRAHLRRWDKPVRLRAAFAVTLSGFVAWSSYRCMRGTIDTGTLMRQPHPCADAIAALRDRTRPEDRVMASNPWLVSWTADRPAIPAPTNGMAAILAVVARYGVEWILVGSEVAGSQELSSVLAWPPARRALRSRLVFDGASCDVYRVRPPRR